MNLERLEIVAKALETRQFPEGFGFCMNDFWHTPLLGRDWCYANGQGSPMREHRCETIGCIAGLTVALFERGLQFPGRIPERAAQLLELESYQSLFLPSGVNYELVTPEAAAAAVRRFIANGGTISREEWQELAPEAVLVEDQLVADE